MTISSLLHIFAEWSSKGRPLVLASVVATSGSTYSKCGAQMLIDGGGNFQGMLSGGCLEGDLAERARRVIESGATQTVVYDLGLNDDELWGLGVGCDGSMTVFLQPLLLASGYEPFATVAHLLQGDREQIVATIVASEISAAPAGATLVSVGNVVVFSDVVEEFVSQVRDCAEATRREGKSACHEFSTETGSFTVLCNLLKPPPSILVLGAGLDAEPVVRFALELGWRVTVQDHRPAYIEAGNFEGATAVHCVPVDELSVALKLNRFSAAIVMSHHLVSDREYLRQLATSNVSYIGLLGPVNRRQKLIAELGSTAADLEPRLHGPAGIDIGGRGPAAIALSIVAGMHRELLLGLTRLTD